MRLLAVPYSRYTAPEGTAQLRHNVAYIYSGYVLHIYNNTYNINTGRATADYGGPRRGTAGSRARTVC